MKLPEDVTGESRGASGAAFVLGAPSPTGALEAAGVGRGVGGVVPARDDTMGHRVGTVDVGDVEVSQETHILFIMRPPETAASSVSRINPQRPIRSRAIRLAHTFPSLPGRAVLAEAGR